MHTEIGPCGSTARLREGLLQDEEPEARAFLGAKWFQSYDLSDFGLLRHQPPKVPMAWIADAVVLRVLSQISPVQAWFLGPDTSKIPSRYWIGESNGEDSCQDHLPHDSTEQSIHFPMFLGGPKKVPPPLGSPIQARKRLKTVLDPALGSTCWTSWRGPGLWAIQNLVPKPQAPSKNLRPSRGSH